MRLAAAAGVLRPTAALLFHSRSRPHRLLPSPRRSSLPFARRRRHSSSSSTATALDDPPPPSAPGPPSPAPPAPRGEGGETKAARRRRARESPEGMLRHRLDMCSRDADLATALELYAAAVDPATAVPLALHHYNCLLYLCSNAAAEDADAARRGFEIFAAMEAQGVEPNEATLTSLARLAAAVRDPAMAFSVVRRMAAAGIPPRLRSYGPALFAYCDARDAVGAAEVEAHMDAGGVVPEETELAALLRVNADTGRADQVYRVLHRTRTLVRQVCEATAQVVEAWFRSDAAAEAGVEKWDARKVREGVVKGGGGWHGQGWLGKGQWDVGQSEMDKNGKCQRCGEKLVCIDIDPSETETFAKSLAELACKREVRDDFIRFQDWLRRNGPFDAVIDAANVGLYNSKAFSFSQVNSVVNGIQRVTKSKKLPLIVLHRSRVNCGPAKAPQNQKLIESWRNAGALYSTPPGSNDDWYWLYAAVSCRSLLVTNDEMRDHLFQLLGTSFFPRWKEKHQVRLTYSGRGPTFHLPPPYSIVIQESEAGSWHVPTTTGDDIESPRQWVCATRKTSEGPPSPPPQARATSKTSERPPSPPPQARASSKTSERPPSPPPQARATSKTLERSPSPPPQARATSKTSERPPSPPPQARPTRKTSERPSSPPPQARATRRTSERPSSPPSQVPATRKTSERPSSSLPQARLSDLGW
uniref:ribonuclease P n=1 Tax=Aegilops tauschii subsp. strangulata TaxID=200361 RepID=A0A453DLY7_AEGTS